MGRKDDIVAAVDFGARMTRVVMARRAPDGRVHVIGNGAAPSRGCVKFGAIQDMNAAVAAFMSALAGVKNTANRRPYGVYCGIHGETMASCIREGKAQVENGVIRPEHLDAARDSAAQQVLEADLRPLSSITNQEWYVDEIHVADPVGMHGSVLRGRIHFARLPMFLERNLTACIDESGCAVEDFVFMPIAAAQGCLSAEDMKLGVCVVDLGASSTGVAVYFMGALVSAACLPLGCELVVNDVAAGLKISFEEATELVMEYGVSEALIASGGVPPAADDTKSGVAPAQIKLRKTVTGAPGLALRSELDSIVYCRCAELIGTIHQFLQNKNHLGRMARGIVLTGGGAVINNYGMLAERQTGLSVRVGVPIEFYDMPETLDAPDWAPVMGVARYGLADCIALRTGKSLMRRPRRNTWWSKVWGVLTGQFL